MRANLVALLLREVVIAKAEHVHLDTGGDESDGRISSEMSGVVWSAIAVRTSSMSRRDAVALHELARRVAAVDLEGKVRAGVGFGQPHVVERRTLLAPIYARAKLSRQSVMVLVAF
jgi:hypothetical protein